jgi:hypothetical protein
MKTTRLLLAIVEVWMLHECVQPIDVAPTLVCIWHSQSEGPLHELFSIAHAKVVNSVYTT